VTPRAAARVAGALALIAALAACSATRVVYENASTLLRWRATSYLDLHGEQLRDLEARIDRFLAWHRRDALPGYAALAEDAGARVARGLSRQDLDWGYDVIRAQLRIALSAGGGEVAPLLDRLNAAQIEHLERRIAEENRKFAEEHLEGTPEERREHRMRRSIERLEDWIGALTDAQRARVRRYSARAPLMAAHRLRDRQRLQGEVLGMIRTRTAGARLAPRLADPEAGRAPAFETANRAHLAELFDMLLDLDRLLTAEQRARAVERLREYAREFRLLAQAPRAEATAPATAQ